MGVISVPLIGLLELVAIAQAFGEFLYGMQFEFSNK